MNGETDLPAPRICYFINVAFKDERGFIPLMVVEGEPGLKVLEEMRWGPSSEAAKEEASRRNAQLGLAPVDVRDILLGTGEN